MTRPLFCTGKSEVFPKRLSEEEVLAACPIGDDGVIHHLSAGTALPGFEGPHEIIEFLSIHAAFAFRTSHVFPLFCYKNKLVCG